VGRVFERVIDEADHHLGVDRLAPADRLDGVGMFGFVYVMNSKE
jgi:hypothetical protein